MKISTTDVEREDLHLVSLLVASMLRREHCRKPAPPLASYSVIDTGRYPMGQKQLRVAVDLDRGLEAVVEDVWRLDDDRETQTTIGSARKISSAISSLQDKASSLRDMLGEVRSAARREVAKARRRGLAYTLTDVCLSSVDAGRDLEPAAMVRVQTLGRSLRPHVSEFHAARAEDVASWFTEVKKQQEDRRLLRERLDASGAAGRIDEVVVNELEAKGLELDEILDRLRSAKDWIVDLDLPDGTRTTLHWNDGSVFSQVILGDGASWSEGTLSLKEAPCALTDRQVGKHLNEVFPHPFLPDDLVISRCRGEKGEWGSIDCRPSMLNFDGESGRLWR